MKRTLFILLALLAIAVWADAGTLIFNGHVIADIDTVVVDGGELKRIVYAPTEWKTTISNPDTLIPIYKTKWCKYLAKVNPDTLIPFCKRIGKTKPDSSNWVPALHTPHK